MTDADADRVRAQAGAGLVGDSYHGSRHRHVSVQSASELAESSDALGAPVDRGGSILRVLASGAIAVGDVWEELEPESGAEVAARATS